jgi:hypothetical protein
LEDRRAHVAHVARHGRFGHVARRLPPDPVGGGPGAACIIAGFVQTRPFTRNSAFWVIADGRRLYTHMVDRLESPLDLDMAIPAGAHYLTIATTDGGDGYIGDWVTLGNPRIW